MSSKREFYLSQVWQKYPECPRGFLQYGRVFNLRLGVNTISEYKAKDAPDYKANEILVDGDLIAIMGNSQFVLLAPNLTQETGFYKVEENPWLRYKSYFEYVDLIRKFFQDKRFLEVRTPVVVECPGTEPSIEVFSTQYQNGSYLKNYFLSTSPEINIKKLISLGGDRVFEIAHVFRNGEKTDRHQFEFTMLEWYRAMSYLQNIKMDVVELIEFLSDKLRVERPKEVLTFTMAELFKQYCQFELTPDTTIEQFQQLAMQLRVDVSAATTIDDYFYLIYLECIENKWPQDRLVFVEKYPPFQAALARVDKTGWAERFEVYWKGLELANAYHELNNPHEQRLRANSDLEQKKLLGKKIVSLDEKFFQSLEYGMPPSAGIALGVERLYMALKNVKSIDTLFFTTK